MIKTTIISMGVAFILSSTSVLAKPDFAGPKPKICKITAIVHEDSTIESWNISETIQAGQVFLKLESEFDGEIIYEEEGAIVGRITKIEKDDYGLPVIFLDHTMIFEDASRIKTKDDRAILDFDPNIEIPEGSVEVEETISQAWGTKVFAQARIIEPIIAKGYTTQEPGGENYFELSGKICLK